MAVAALAVVACSTTGLEPRAAKNRIFGIERPGFSLIGRYYPAAAPSSSLFVVIEGDGARWKGGQPPDDPTPRRSAGSAILANLPDTANRLYLARPCQFLDPGPLASCDSRYWTGDRFAPDVIAALDAAIDQFARSDGEVYLIGFSGGGVLAAELALRRRDVAGLVTLAAPLDLDSWTTAHTLPPLQSPTPPDALLRDLSAKPYPRAFVFGGRDQVVPEAALVRLRLTLPAELVREAPHMTHDGPWHTLWRDNGFLVWLASEGSRRTTVERQ